MAPSAVTPGRRQTYLPGLTSLARTVKQPIRADLIAGVAVAAYAIPQVVAYADLAGLPASIGVWALVAPAVLYAIFGTSRRLSIGPESTTALMVVAIVAPLAHGDPRRYVAIAGLLALMVGVIALLARAARLGFLANLLGRPVLVGYMAGVGVLMIVSQLGKVFGVSVSGTRTIDEVRSFVAHVHELNLPTVAVAAGTFLVLVVTRRWLPKTPGPLLAIVAATFAVVTLGLKGHGVAVVGRVPGGLPQMSWAVLHWADLPTVLIAACAVTAVAFSDNVVTARSFAARHGERVDPDSELLALGMVNIGAGLLGGMPVSSSGSRAAIADAAGARSQLYSLVVAACAAVVAFAGGGMLASFPKAALGALVVFAALHLVDLAELRRLFMFRKTEAVLAVCTAAGVTFLGVLPGIGIAVVLSAVALLARLSRPHDAICGTVEGLAGLHDIDDHPGATTVPGLVVYRFDGPLTFMSAEFFLERAIAAVQAASPPVEWLLLNVEAVVDVDATGIEALLELHQYCQRNDVTIALARLKHDLAVELHAAKAFATLDERLVFATLPTALSHISQLLAA